MLDRRALHRPAPKWDQRCEKRKVRQRLTGLVLRRLFTPFDQHQTSMPAAEVPRRPKWRDYLQITSVVRAESPSGRR
jgi:hypothetical protein